MLIDVLLKFYLLIYDNFTTNCYKGSDEFIFMSIYLSDEVYMYLYRVKILLSSKIKFSSYLVFHLIYSSFHCTSSTVIIVLLVSVSHICKLLHGGRSPSFRLH